MPDSSTSEPESDFVCGCGDESMRSACAGEPFYKEHKGKRYCVLHSPGKEKSADFEKALQRKLEKKDFNFRGVWFPDELKFSRFTFSAPADFRFATFNADVDFHSATFRADSYFSAAAFGAAVSFRAVIFSSAVNFSSALFSADADFNTSTFSADADFTSATFRAAADFRFATFIATVDFNAGTFGATANFSSGTFGAAAYFSAATFGAAADFSSGTFGAAADFNSANLSSLADFSYTTFNGKAVFPRSKDIRASGDQASFDFKFAKIKTPKSFSLPAGMLRPHWFINVDLRKFDLANVGWRSKPSEEIRSLERKKKDLPEDSSPSLLLSDVYRRLALNAEQIHHYPDASLFRYGSMDAWRPQKWGGLKFWKTDMLHWIYWATSGYGERVFRAFLWLIGLWFIFALFYTQIGFAQPEPRLGLSRALTYSAGVMALQKPEPRPATTAAQTVVLFETILGPVQAALLALAIRRKFMR